MTTMDRSRRSPYLLLVENLHGIEISTGLMFDEHHTSEGTCAQRAHAFEIVRFGGVLRERKRTFLVVLLVREALIGTVAISTVRSFVNIPGMACRT